MEQLLELKDVSVRHPGTLALQGISFAIHRGEHWALTGPSGSGKTLLTLAITGGDAATAAVLGEAARAEARRQQTHQVERLQADRSQVVNLMDQLVRQTPDGVYLKTIKQTGLRGNLVGYAQSNARVSQLMRNFTADIAMQPREGF